MRLAVTQVNGSGGGNSNDLGGDKVKRLSAIADRVGCNLVQLQLAWQLRNQVSPLMHLLLCLDKIHKIKVEDNILYRSSQCFPVLSNEGLTERLD